MLVIYGYVVVTWWSHDGYVLMPKPRCSPTRGGEGRGRSDLTILMVTMLTIRTKAHLANDMRDGYYSVTLRRGGHLERPEEDGEEHEREED